MLIFITDEEIKDKIQIGREETKRNIHGIEQKEKRKRNPNIGFTRDDVKLCNFRHP